MDKKQIDNYEFSKYDADTFNEFAGELMRKYTGGIVRKNNTLYQTESAIDLLINNQGINIIYRENDVSELEVTKYLAGLKMFNLEPGYIITNKGFSEAARTLARKKHIILCDETEIKRMLKEIELKEDQKRVVDEQINQKKDLKYADYYHPRLVRHTYELMDAINQTFKNYDKRIRQDFSGKKQVELNQRLIEINKYQASVYQEVKELEAEYNYQYAELEYLFQPIINEFKEQKQIKLANDTITEWELKKNELEQEKWEIIYQKLMKIKQKLESFDGFITWKSIWKS